LNFAGKLRWLVFGKLGVLGGGDTGFGACVVVEFFFGGRPDVWKNRGHVASETSFVACWVIFTKIDEEPDQIGTGGQILRNKQI